MFSAFYLANCCQFHRLIVIFINIIFSAVGVTLFRTPQGESRSIGQSFVVSKSRDGLLEDDGHVGMPNKAESAAAVLLRQLLGCPFGRDASCCAEILQVNLTNCCPVVISSDNDIRACP